MRSASNKLSLKHYDAAAADDGRAGLENGLKTKFFRFLNLKSPNVRFLGFIFV